MSAGAILITGCSTGIGRCCALGMKARGWRVFATARKNADIEALQAEGLEALFLDYMDTASIEACAAHVLAETGGRIDAVFNNGAYGQPGAVEDIRTDVLRAQFETNLFGWHDLTLRLLRSMRQRGSGRIVNCSSVLGLVAMRYRGAYNASKFALEGLTDTLRLELAGSGIHVSLIEPGPIASRFRANCLTMFLKHVDQEKSAHRENYARELRRLQGEEKPSIFKLGPEAVLKALIHAVESPKPRAHYHVTNATKLVALARRILPERTLDRLAVKIS